MAAIQQLQQQQHVLLHIQKGNFSRICISHLSLNWTESRTEIPANNPRWRLDNNACATRRKGTISAAGGLPKHKQTHYNGFCSGDVLITPSQALLVS